MNRPSRKQLTLQQLLMLRGTALLMGILLLLGAVDYSTGGRPRVEYRSR